MEQKNLNTLLAQVIGEAAALGIPVSNSIHPQVILNGRAVSRFGCCRKVGLTYYIEVSARLLEGGEGALRETLAHEVLHTCRGCRDHGPRWKGYAAGMNAAYGYRVSRTGSWEGLGLQDPRPVRYLLTCESCGLEIKRAKASALVRHPERYHCRCGGRILLRKGGGAP